MSASDDFVSHESKTYRFRMGTVIASSLSGFIAGALIASIAWLLVIIAGKV